MGPRILWASSVSVLLLLVLGAVPALAHPPAPPPEPDPTERSLFLIARESASPDQKHPMTVALAQDPNSTSAGSLSYQFANSWPGGPQCAGYPGCGPVRLEAVLADGEKDFELVRDKEYVGQLHFAWTYRENLPNAGLWSSTVGRVDVGLTIGDVSYGTQSKVLTARGSGSGDVVLDLVFGVHGDAPHNQSGGHRPHNASASENHHQIWAHDVGFHVYITPYYSGSPSAILGSQLMVKLDTGGGTWLRVHEAVPPPPEPVPPAETAAESYDSGLEDGVDEEIELYFTPGPSLPLVALSVIAGLFALRRRRDA